MKNLLFHAVLWVDFTKLAPSINVCVNKNNGITRVKKMIKFLKYFFCI